MREKVVPIPFLSKEVSAWLYRTTRRVREHPYRASGIVLGVAVSTILYEANVTHKDRIPSPNVNNHLEYELRREPKGVKSMEEGALERSQHQLGVSFVNSQALDDEWRKHNAAVLGRVRELEQLIASTSDSEKREELQRLLDEEKESEKKHGGTTMKVTSGQLYVREPHWNIRNNERNWTILARDQQQQKDHYWYRLERSREDDFARNTYSRL
ncbi:hypothetical protein C3747_40g241 [Trypanosoma cruzi]|uniref:Uncharacterized protein n=2 Tax=Trypanosoma cruzi TaxID=5693 RepID=Q4DZQ1_TRYCC|nr:hypothetical protein, conserved [Trypanosoma cruzi]EAN98022.1 hypothetical protein, conserved [Trypanosoma cruzi]PWV13869.1 hypothetical protein C3747_40g241 [Trypanosoma cruzi]RNC59559.1 hypothetical protein TcCL_ESM02762 [Trypanosoma cruzi]|eukprot:XP_819873.1 hypothetical protein [Trypanosoma cruzi strain CL Brener]